MYVTVRRYKNAGGLVEAMSSKSDEIKKLLTAITGFVNYFAMREGDMVTTISIYSDKAGCDESTLQGGQWVRDNAKPLPGAPEISSGEVFVNF